MSPLGEQGHVTRFPFYLKGLLEDMRNAPDKLTSTHHTKHIPKQQQTNKNDADWALA